MPTEVEKLIVAEAKRLKEPLPERIANKPLLHLGLALFLNAWFELDTERNHANGYVRIPASKVREYADYYELDEEQREDLWYYVGKLDDEAFKRWKAKQPKPTATKKRWFGGK